MCAMRIQRTGCPYDVSSNATYRMKQHEKTRHWYKFKDEHKQTEEQNKKTPTRKCSEVDEPVVENDKSAQAKETPDEIQEPDDHEQNEQPEENTFTEVREELVEVSEDGVELMNEDIRLVEINGMTPTPNYLPSRITPTNLKYGRVYDYRQYGLPEDKDKEDPRHVLLCPTSTYHSSKEAILLRRLREQAGRSRIDTTTLPDGYSGLVKTERCELPDGTVYSLTSHWLPEIPVRRYKTSGSQVSTTLETCDKDVQVVPTTTISETQTEKIEEIPEKTHEDKEVNCDINACLFY
ncbi:unnamed protein product [Mytilus coruscus]|uniref:Uncharacterized protein n=1 Tax=Mytilus coruscus TaxID=42192 RepID=A0A6J8EUM1_MYTCO|nr:unnamed protein product [Mytilus coruscus]